MVEFIVLGKGETLSWQSKHTVGGSGLVIMKKREKVGSEKNRGRKGEMGAGGGEGERERQESDTQEEREKQRERI